MKKIFLPAVLLILLGSSILAQNTEKQITAIRAEVAAINKSAAKYTKTSKDVEGISLEGTEATYYVSGRGLQKVVAKMYGESYNATGEYYYVGEDLIFAFIKLNKYDRGIGSGKAPKIVSTEEQRFYFAGGNLIRMLVGNKELKSGDERYDELKGIVTDSSAKLKAAY